MAEENSDDQKAMVRTPATLYADGMLQFAVGPQISKVVFAVDGAVGAENAPRPAFTVAMPTARVKEMALNILSLIQSPDVKRGMISDWQKLIAETQEEADPPEAS